MTATDHKQREIRRRFDLIRARADELSITNQVADPKAKGEIQELHSELMSHVASLQQMVGQVA